MKNEEFGLRSSACGFSYNHTQENKTNFHSSFFILHSSFKKRTAMDIFSKIAAGEIPSYKCAENEEFYAFLDINPLVVGHTLVIPRREVDYIFDMDDDEIARYQVFAKKVAKAVKMAFPCLKVAEVVLGLEVPHAHIHLIPMQSEKDAVFTNPKLKLSEDEFRAAAEKIYSAFCSL